MFKSILSGGEKIRKNDVITRLNDVHKKLTDLSQEDRPPGLEKIAAELVSDTLLNHSDRDIRLLASCCLADILRIFAPEAPFGDDEVLVVFESFISQIRLLSAITPETGTWTKNIYILRSLATVKSCVIPVLLIQSGVEGAAEVVISMFTTLLSCIRSDQTEDVCDFVSSILIACVEEYENPDQDILDLLLAPLLPSCKTDNPATYKVISSVLRRVMPQLQYPLSKFFNRVLIGAGNDGTASELDEHAYALLYELHKIYPELLFDVLPSLCSQLEAEEEAVRLTAVKLLGRLFASTQADYGREFNRNFREFLGRFFDNAASIRAEMVTAGALIMKKKAYLRQSVEERMVARIKDNEVDIRLLALTKLMELLYEDPTTLSIATVLELSQRARDKKPEVVRAVIAGLGRSYYKHVSSLLAPLAGAEASSSSIENNSAAVGAGGGGYEKALWVAASEGHPPGVRPEVFERLRIVPAVIVNCWGYPDTQTRHLILQTIQENLLPRAIRRENGSDSDNQQVSMDSHDNVVPAAVTATSALTTGGKSKKSTARASPALTQTDSENSQENTQEEKVQALLLGQIDSIRATALLLVFECLNSNERSAFGTILAYKSKVRLELSNFLEQRVHAVNGIREKSLLVSSARASLASTSGRFSRIGAVSAAPEDDDADTQLLLLKKSMHRLLQALPAQDKKSSILDKLPSMKDKTIFRLLSRCTQAKDSITDACDKRDDLKQRLDSRSALGQYSACLFDTAGFLLVNESVVACLLGHAVRSAAAMPHHDARGKQRADSNLLEDLESTSQLVCLLSKHAPAAFGGSASLMTKWLISAAGASADTNALSSRRIEMLRECALSVAQAAPALGKGEEVGRESSNLCATLLSLARSYEGEEDAVSSLCVSLGEAALRVSLCARMSAGAVVSEGVKSKGRVVTDKNPIVDCINDLTKARVLTTSNKKLHSEFGLLAALATIPPTGVSGLDYRAAFASLVNVTISSVRDTIIDFITRSLDDGSFVGASAGNDEDEAGSDEDGENPRKIGRANTRKKATVPRRTTHASAFSRSSVHAKAVAAALMLWTSLLISDEEVRCWHAVAEPGDSADDALESRELSSEQGSLVSALFHTLLRRGENIVGSVGDHTAAGVIFPTASGAAVLVRETAAACIIRLLKLKVIDAAITVDQWRVLSMAFLDEEVGVRQRLLNELSTVIQTTSVNHRFLAIPCLLATDERLSGLAERALMFAVRRLRCTHEDLCSRALHEESDDARALAEYHMPEAILPYVLYLLSYHPEFPTTPEVQTEEDTKRTVGIMRCVKMVLSVLFGTLHDEGDNLSFLLKQVNLITQHYRDRADAANIGLHFVAQLTIKLLSEKIKTSENVQLYPGNVHLPMDLFEIRPTGKQRGHGFARDDDEVDGLNVDAAALDAAVMKGLVNTDGVLNRVLQQAGATAGGAGGVRRAAAKKAKADTPSALVLKVRTAMTRKPAATKPRSKVSAISNDYDENVAPNSESGRVANAHKRVGNEGERVEETAPVRISSRPQRSTRAQISYKEKDVSEKEVLEWEREAAEARATSSKRVAGVGQYRPRAGLQGIPSSTAAAAMAKVGAGRPVTSSHKRKSWSDDEDESSRPSDPSTITSDVSTSSVTESSPGSPEAHLGARRSEGRALHTGRDGERETAAGQMKKRRVEGLTNRESTQPIIGVAAIKADSSRRR